MSMILLRLRVTTFATSCNLWKSNAPFEMNVGKARDAKLQTAVSSGAEYSIISQHKFNDLIVPRCC